MPSLRAIPLKRRTVLVLAVVVALATTAFLLLNAAITRQEVTAAVLESSARQRIHSLEIALGARRFAGATDGAERAEAGRELAAALARFEALQGALAEWTGAAANPVLRDYAAAVRRLLESGGGDGDLQPAPETVGGVIDLATADLLRETAAHTGRLRQGAAALVGGTLLLLAIEATLVFRPVVRRFRAAVREAGRQRNEHADSEARFRAMVDVVVSGIVTINEHGAIDVFNHAAEAIFGYTADEVRGANVSVLMPEPDRSAHDGYLCRHLETGYASVIGRGREVTGRRKDGSLFPLDLAVAPFEAGGRRMFVGVLTDISERKAREEELRDSRRHLERQAAEMTELAAHLEVARVGAESRLRILFETVNAGILTVDPATMRILSANPCAERLFGHSGGAMVGLDGRDLVVDAELAAVMAVDEGSAAGDQANQRAEGRFRRRDGTRFTAEVSGSSFRDPATGRLVWLGVVQDLTPLKQAERLLRDAVESIDQSFALFDAEDRLVLCNRRLGEFYPTIRDLLEPGTPFLSLLRASVLRGQFMMVPAGTDAWLSGQVAVHVAFREPVEQHLADGRWLLVQEQRFHNGNTVVVGTDITDLKRREEELTGLAQRNAMLAAAVANVITGIAITDGTREGNPVIFVNQAFASLTGYAPEEALGRGIDLLFGPDTDAQARRELDEAVRAFRPAAVEVVCRCKDGRTFLNDLRVSPVLDEDGRPLHFVAVVQDVTERRARERALLHDQRIRALGTLAGGIAHDLNNALMPILGLAEMSLMDMPADHSERDNLKTIMTAGERARDLVRQILAFSRKIDPIRRPVDLVSVAEETLTLLRATIPANIAIRLDRQPVSMVMADTGQMQQVLVNLVINAAQAIGDAVGTVTITARDRPEDMVELTVRDDGPGIDEATQQRLFEPFFTTKPVGQGTGLGLSVVHGIVTGFGGTVTVASQPGCGATFTILLPRAEAGALQSA